MVKCEDLTYLKDAMDDILEILDTLHKEVSDLKNQVKEMRELIEKEKTYTKNDNDNDGMYQ